MHECGKVQAPLLQVVQVQGECNIMANLDLTAFRQFRPEEVTGRCLSVSKLHSTVAPDRVTSLKHSKHKATQDARTLKIRVRVGYTLHRQHDTRYPDINTHLPLMSITEEACKAYAQLSATFNTQSSTRIPDVL